MNDPDCIFCKIINGDIPSQRVYENEHCYAFLDIAPFEKGHTLIVPKHHFKILTDLTEEVLSQLILATQRVAAKLLQSMPCDGFNLLQNNGICATQTVPHVHFHVIPRWNNQEPHWHSNKAYNSEEEMFEIYKRIRFNG